MVSHFSSIADRRFRTRVSELSVILGIRMPDARGRVSGHKRIGALMKVVFLHGIGDGDPNYGWLDGLNRGLMQAGHEPIDREQVIAPRYSSYLRTEGRSGKLPPPHVQAAGRGHSSA